MIASGSNDKNVKLWNSETGKIIETFKGHESPVTNVIFNADNLESWSLDGKKIEWKIPVKSEVNPLEDSLKIDTPSTQLIAEVIGNRIKVKKRVYNYNPGFQLSLELADSERALFCKGSLFKECRLMDESLRKIMEQRGGKIT